MQAQSADILARLRTTLDATGFDDVATAVDIEKLKVIARDPRQAPKIYAEDGFATLVSCAFGPTWPQRPKSSVEAAKVIANALFLQNKLYSVFDKLIDYRALVAFYDADDSNHEFLGARILFLVTYSTTTDLESIRKEHALAEVIERHFAKKSRVKPVAPAADPMAAMATLESLKLTFNLASKCTSYTEALTPIIDHVIRLTCNLKTVDKLEPPNAQAINVLAVVDWPSNDDELQLAEQLPELTKVLLEILGTSLDTYKIPDLDVRLIPLLTVIRKVELYKDSPARILLQETLLPSLKDREVPLGKSESLASKLLQTQSSAGVTNLPEAIGGLLYSLSDSDAPSFIRNIGYGNAAGYLATHKIALPPDMQHSAPAEDDPQQGVPINPVTGQRLDAEIQAPGSEMTREEKEREAERLFVLFERLKATGVMKAENPLRTAVQEGRFEELSDSDPD